MDIANGHLADRGLLPRGHFRMDVLRDGRLIERVDEPNMVVVGARQVCAALLAGGGQPIAKIGFGSSAAVAAFGNTTLSTPFLKAIDGANTSPVDPGTVLFQFSLSAAEGNGLSIGEFGLLTAAGMLVARKNRIAAPIPKDATISLAGVWSLTFPTGS
jgi:hypothetical protein